MKKLILTIGLIFTILLSQTIVIDTALAGPGDSVPGAEELDEDYTPADFDVDDEGSLDTPASDPANSTNSTNIADPSLDGDGIRINNQFKPINAPDAFNSNYTSNTVNAFLQFIAGSLIEITASVSVFILVIAGYMFVTAGGDQGRIDKAKDIIKYTIMGMFIVILSFVIVKTVISLLLEVDTF